MHPSQTQCQLLVSGSQHRIRTHVDRLLEPELADVDGIVEGRNATVLPIVISSLWGRFPPFLGDCFGAVLVPAILVVTV